MNYKMISADDHLDLQYLPTNLWTERLPKALRDRAPHIEDRDGNSMWVCDGEAWGRWAGTRRPTGPKALFNAFDRGGLDETELRPAQAALRLADMDRDGVEAQVMFGPVAAMAMLPMQGMGWLPQWFHDIEVYLAMGLTAPVWAFFGWRFHRAALLNLRHDSTMRPGSLSGQPSKRRASSCPSMSSCFSVVVRTVRQLPRRARPRVSSRTRSCSWGSSWTRSSISSPGAFWSGIRDSSW